MTSTQGSVVAGYLCSSVLIIFPLLVCHKQDVVKARMWGPGNIMPFPSYLRPQQKPKREPNSSQKGNHHTPINQRRRPRRPPLRRVESEGVGVTSSIRPIFMPARARARRADWAPGPGVLVPLPLNPDISNHRQAKGTTLTYHRWHGS